MDPFGYLLILTSVILGLAISDLAISTHRLMDAGKRVKWDWLAPLAAIMAFEHIIEEWWGWYGTAGIAGNFTFGMFLGVLISTFLLFLLAAAALPDDTNDEEIDLRVHYTRVSQRFWLLFTAQWVLINAVSIWIQIQVGHARSIGLSPFDLIPVAGLTLAFISRRGLHFAGLIGFIAFYLVIFFGKPLT